MFMSYLCKLLYWLNCTYLIIHQHNRYQFGVVSDDLIERGRCDNSFFIHPKMGNWIPQTLHSSTGIQYCMMFNLAG